MTNLKQTYKDTIDKALNLIKLEPSNKAITKLIAISSLSNSSIKNVCEVFLITNKTIKSWVVAFDKEGIDGLKNKVKNPKKPKLNDHQKERVKSWLNDNPNLTLKFLKLKIKKEWGVDISLVGIWKNLKQMNFSHIIARPVHYKQDKEKPEEFKKNSNRNKRKQSK